MIVIWFRKHLTPLYNSTIPFLFMFWLLSFVLHSFYQFVSHSFRTLTHFIHCRGETDPKKRI